MRVKFDTRNFLKALNGVVEYSQGFYEEAKKNESKLTKKISETSIEIFYDYLDGLARSHPGMLHHVYEWGQVGNPSQRLYELISSTNGSKAIITAEFLESNSLPDGSNTPFYDKAYIMEEGIEVTIKEVKAKALFFMDGGEEFFRTGPIVIANPGGRETRGSFVKAFNEFYNNYFEEVYLKSIQFYNHFSSPKEYSKYIKTATKSNSAKTLGRRAGLSWIEKAPV